MSAGLSSRRDGYKWCSCVAFKQKCQSTDVVSVWIHPAGHSTSDLIDNGVALWRMSVLQVDTVKSRGH